MKCTLLFSAISGARYSQFALLFAFDRARDYSCFGIYSQSILLQFKVTRRHLSLYFGQFSFTIAVNFYAQLNQFNYRNVEIFRNLCAYSRRFDVMSMSGYFCSYIGYPVNGYILTLPIHVFQV